MTCEEVRESHPLVAKLAKVVALKVEDDQELLDGLKSLSVFFSDNNIRNRRNLRSLVEKEGVDIRRNVLKLLGSVVQQVTEMSEMTEHMNERCVQMSLRLNDTKAQTRHLIQKTTAMQLEGQKLELKVKVASAFVHQFQLNENEINALNTGDGVDDNFFKSLERLREVEEHCRLLLRLPNQTAGVEGLENVSALTEAAYERLYRWIQRCCRQMAGESCEISGGLCKAMSYLQERPVILKYVLDEFSSARRGACARSFIDALTSSKICAPIELHAHDPLRYASDLLACVHQLAATEKEHIRSLTKKCIEDDDDIKKTIDECLDSICNGLCHPLKMRMEKLLIQEQDLLILYKINHLLNFYRQTLEQLLTADCSLCNTLEEMSLLSWRLFYSQLKIHSSTLLEKVEPPHHNLAPTTPVKHTLRLLEDILTAQDVSMLPTASNKTHLQQIVYGLIDPLLQYCSLSASSVGPIEGAVYLCNCLYVGQIALARFEYTDTKLEQIQGQLEANVDSLVSFQAGFVIRGSGLTTLYEVVDGSITVSSGASLAEKVSELVVKKIMAQFDLFLASPDSLMMPQLSLLVSTKLKDLIRRRSNDLVHSTYSRIFTAIKDPASGYQDPLTLVPRTPEQVADLILNC